MKPDYKKVLGTVYREQDADRRKMFEEKGNKEKKLKELPAGEKRTLLEDEVQEIGLYYRHLGVHLEYMEQFMEGKIGPLQNKKVKAYQSELRKTKKAHEDAEGIADLQALYDYKMTLLELIISSVFLEMTESSALVYHLRETERKIGLLEKKRS